LPSSEQRRSRRQKKKPVRLLFRPTGEGVTAKKNSTSRGGKEKVRGEVSPPHGKKRKRKGGKRTALLPWPRKYLSMCSGEGKEEGEFLAIF